MVIVNGGGRDLFVGCLVGVLLDSCCYLVFVGVFGIRKGSYQLYQWFCYLVVVVVVG